MNRRHFMTHMAGLSAMTVPGLTFLSNLKAQSETMKKNGKSLIVLWMSGGPTTLDLWDPKYGHPNGGAFKAMNTAASGVQVTEHLPRSAKLAHKYTIIRSMTHKTPVHVPACGLILSGHVPLSSITHPCVGSVVSKELGPRNELPGFVAVPASTGYWESAGYLEPRHNPFDAGNPNVPKYQVRDLEPVSYTHLTLPTNREV